MEAAAALTIADGRHLYIEISQVGCFSENHAHVQFTLAQDRTRVQVALAPLRSRDDSTPSPREYDLPRSEIDAFLATLRQILAQPESASGRSTTMYRAWISTGDHSPILETKSSCMPRRMLEEIAADAASSRQQQCAQALAAGYHDWASALYFAVVAFIDAYAT